MAFESALLDEEKRLSAKAYPEGKYCQIYDTNAYIGLMHEYMQFLIVEQDYDAAVEIGEKIIRLNKTDKIDSVIHECIFMLFLIWVRRQSSFITNQKIDKVVCF